MIASDNSCSQQLLGPTDCHFHERCDDDDDLTDHQPINQEQPGASIQVRVGRIRLQARVGTLGPASQPASQPINTSQAKHEEVFGLQVWQYCGVEVQQID